jgi:hypothetical protein
VRDLDLPPIVFVLVLCFCVAASICFGLGRGQALMEEAAVLKGHAEWVADTSGKPQFKWKECK